MSCLFTFIVPVYTQFIHFRESSSTKTFYISIMGHNYLVTVFIINNNLTVKGTLLWFYTPGINELVLTGYW